MHPSRLAQLETNGFGPAFTVNSESAIVAAPTPRPHPSLSIQPVQVPHSEDVPSTPTKPPGMHPDRIAFLSTDNRPPSAVTSTQFSPHVNLSGSQQHKPPEERFVDRFPSLPTFSPNETVLPQDEPIASSSRVTLDDLGRSHAYGSRDLSSFTSFNFNDQHIPPRAHKDPSQSPSPSKNGKAAQKRKASEALLPPKPPKSPKIQKFEKGRSGNGNNAGGPGPAEVQGMALKKKWKKKRRRGKGKANSQPEPSNSRRN